MHRAVLSALRAEAPTTVISAHTGGAGRTATIVYAPDRDFPLWIAKTAKTPAACQILEREREMLDLLGPWAEELHIPRKISWDCYRGEACLIVSSLPGVHRHLTLPLDGEPGSRMQDVQIALDWLQRFRERVPRNLLDPWEAGTAATRETLASLDEWCVGLLDVLRTADDVGETMASHGDFWHGNLIYDGDRMSVIDWDSLGTRSPLHDVLWLFTNCRYEYDGEAREHLNATIFFRLFFSDAPVARIVRRASAKFGLNERQMRNVFYWFVGESIRVTGGAWRTTWFEIARTLHKAGYPGPWSCPLAPDSAQESRVSI